MKTCDTCGALATHSTTDSVQTVEGWAETPEQRYGCAVHAVEAKIHLIDGRVLSVREYETLYY